MKYKPLISALLGLLLLIPSAQAQFDAPLEVPVEWSTALSQRSDSVLTVILTAKLPAGWHLYSIALPAGGPNPTRVVLSESESFRLVDTLREEGEAVVARDEVFGIDLTYFADSVRLLQDIRPSTREAFEVRGSVEFQTCHDGACNLGEWDFVVRVGAEGQRLAAADAPSADPVPTEGATPAEVISPEAMGEEGDSNAVFFLLCFLAGLAGLLTPCVFPMIPMTVSFFLGKKNRLNAMLNAVVFGVSIIAIYTLLGLVVSLTSMGADFITDLTTHWITNLIFFLLFIIFGAAFFGMFEIRLPSSIATKTDAQSSRGGFVGSFFFALTTVVVSLSCVGPIVGALLVESAAGASIRPVLGMFAFSLGFSLPFTLFAFFPSWLNKLPKSGGWMNSVKVVLGFIVLAFSMKFLLGIDTALGLGLITRPIFLTIWIALAIFLCLYLLGHLRFKMDSPLTQGVPFLRMILALASLSFAIYLVPGLFGAPLYGLSGFLPAPTSDDFTLSQPAGTTATPPNALSLCETPKYADIIHLPQGLEGYRDYQQALACAKERNKPLLVEFSGHGCANCKEMSAKVLSRPEVSRFIMTHFIPTVLYVDEKLELPETEWYTSPRDGKLKKTLGKQNLDLQATKFKANGQPLFFVVAPDERILAGPQGRETDVKAFLDFLEGARGEFERTK